MTIENMLLPAWALFALCVALGVLGFWMSYAHKRAVVVPVLAVLAIATANIVRLRDPLSLAPKYRLAGQGWPYIVALFWSVVLGVTLPLVGKYLGARRSR